MENSHMILSNCDTDSISICKPDHSEFTKEERSEFLKKLNSIFPENIVFADDGYFPRFIVLKAKNYIMLKEDGTIKLKGSSLKSSTLEPILKQFLNEIIDSLLKDKNDFVDIYNKYIRMAANITDIKPWCSKKTLSQTTYQSERANETKIIDAINGTDYVEGDKVYTFYDEDDALVLAENFKGSYNKMRMYEKLYKATSRFWTVLDKDIFINYKLKRHQKALEELLK